MNIESIDCNSGDVETVENLYMEKIGDTEFIEFSEVSGLPAQKEPIKISLKGNHFIYLCIHLKNHILGKNCFSVGDALKNYAGKVGNKH